MRETDSSTSQGVAASGVKDLADAVRPLRRWRGLVFGVVGLGVLLLLGGIFAAIRWTGGPLSSSGEVVAIDGNIYSRDRYDDDAVAPSELGAVVGVVAQSISLDIERPELRQRRLKPHDQVHARIYLGGAVKVAWLWSAGVGGELANSV